MAIRYQNGLRCFECDALPGRCDHPRYAGRDQDERVVEVHPRVSGWYENKDGSGCQTGHDVVIVETCAGRVVADDGVREVRVMSDVWDMHRAFVIALPNGAFEVRTVYPDTTVEVDAPELEPAYRAWVVEQERARLELAAEERRAKAEAAAVAAELEPIKGCLARVVRGRKVPKGVVGEVIWTGVGDWGARVGLATPTGVVWTAASNVERLRDGEAICGHPECGEDLIRPASEKNGFCMHRECNRETIEAISRVVAGRATRAA